MLSKAFIPKGFPISRKLSQTDFRGSSQPRPRISRKPLILFRNRSPSWVFRCRIWKTSLIRGAMNVCPAIFGLAQCRARRRLGLMVQIGDPCAHPRLTPAHPDCGARENSRNRSRSMQGNEFGANLRTDRERVRGLQNCHPEIIGQRGSLQKGLSHTNSANADWIVRQPG